MQKKSWWLAAAAVGVVLALSQHAGYAQPPAYSMPPSKLAKALALNRRETLLQGISLVWGLASLLLILRLGVADRLQRIAARGSRNAILQGFLYLPLLLCLITLLDLPISVYGHRVGVAFGLSVQHWGSWLLDWTKSLVLTIVLGTLVFSILFAIIRRSPRRWWFWFWIGSIPLSLISVFLVPVVIDPLFNHYEPLAQSNPALVAQLEKVVQKSGLTIPPSRMFLMRASDKVTTSNAYVTGFGASKRVVVWDTAIRSSTPDGILFIFGHELGHYVLGHIVHGLVLSNLGSLVFLWFGYHLVRSLIRRYGSSWQITDVSDWSAVTVLLLVAGVLSFLSSPVENAVSRHFEHQADIYGQEAIHDIVADPQKTAQASFQELGEDALDIPNPNPIMVFWDFSHPTILQRATFARDYNPWAPGQKPKYFR